MEDQQTKLPEYYEIKINDNILRIEINNEQIIYSLIIGVSYYKYIKEYTYEEIVKELDIKECKDILEVYNYLKNKEHKIVNDDKVKKIIVNGKEIKLKEKTLSNEELIKVLMGEIMKQNEKINKLENKNKELIEKINELDLKKKIKMNFISHTMLQVMAKELIFLENSLLKIIKKIVYYI